MVSFKSMKKNRVVKILVILAFAFLLFGCPAEGNEVAVEKKCSLYGKIIDENVKDMTIYTVRLTDENGWMSPAQNLASDGQYRFNNLIPGVYKLSIYIPSQDKPVKVVLFDIKPSEEIVYNYIVEKSTGSDIIIEEPKPSTNYRVVKDGKITTTVRGIDIVVPITTGRTEILPRLTASGRDSIIKGLYGNSQTRDKVISELSKEVTDTRIIDAYKGSVEYLVGLTLKLEWSEEFRLLVSKLHDLLGQEYLNSSKTVSAGDVVMLQMTEALIMNLAEIGEFTDGKLVSPQPAIESFPKTALIELDEYAFVLAHVYGIRNIDVSMHDRFMPVPDVVLLENNAEGALFFADMAFSSMKDVSEMNDEQLKSFWNVAPIYESCYQLFNKYYSNDSSTRWYELHDNYADVRIVLMGFYMFFDSQITNLLISADNIKLLDSFDFDVDRLKKYRADEIMMAIIEASGVNRKKDNVSMYIPAYFFKDGIDLVTVQQKLNDHTDPDTIKLRNVLFDRGGNPYYIGILNMLPDVFIDGIDGYEWNLYIESFKKTFSQKLT